MKNKKLEFIIHGGLLLIISIIYEKFNYGLPVLLMLAIRSIQLMMRLELEAYRDKLPKYTIVNSNKMTAEQQKVVAGVIDRNKESLGKEKP